MHWSCRRCTLIQNTWQQTRYFNVDFDSNGLLFVFYVFSRGTFNLEKNKKHLLRKMFGSPHTINRIYLLWNCFSNYVYLKDIYITVNGI